MIRNIVLAVAFAASAGTAVSAQTASQPTTAADRVRALYLVQDYEGAAAEGQKLIKATPGDQALRAWTALSLSRSSQQPAAMAMADSMAKRAPRSMWSHFARAVALAYAPSEQAKDPDALAAAEQARKLAPRDPDALWVHAYVLANQGKYDAELAMLDSVMTANTWVELRNMRATALMNGAYPSGQPADTARFTRGLLAFAETRALHPDNYAAWSTPGYSLYIRRRVSESLPLLEQALKIAPQSIAAHQRWWWAVQGRTDWTEEQKAAAIAADADELLKVAGTSADNLLKLSGAYSGIKRWDRMNTVDARIIAEYPGTEQEAWVHVNRYRALADSLYKKEIADTAGVRTRLLNMYWTFLDRKIDSPVHLSDVYLTLLGQIASDTTVPPARLLQVVQGTAKYNDINPHITRSMGPLALADRGIYLKEAEAIAREGMTHALAYMKGRKASYSDREGEYLTQSNSLQAIQYDALGWILHKQGRREEAMKALNQALEYNKSMTMAFYHLGRIAELEGDHALAEQHYAKGRGFELMGLKRNTEALKALYAKQHGSMTGYDEYANALDEKDRDRRWNGIVETREKTPKQMPAFDLVGVDGKRLSSADLKGKFVIVNFWGVWCGPCVYETPELQKLYDRLKDNPDVVFVTIANDVNPQTTKDFMVKRKFTFPALLDNGFVATTGTIAFPTTWFVDREGNIQFTHRGASDVVLEEFLWRVDLLRGVNGRQPII